MVCKDERVLLVCRGKPPHFGQWAIPGGRVRWGETLRAAAEREILEETGVRIRAGETIYQFEHIERDAEGKVRYHFVVIDLLGEYLDGVPQAASDALDARWVAFRELDAMPVNPTTREALAALFPQFF